MPKNHEFKTGLIVGKFCPLHKGHELLIDAAAAQCDKIFIISYTKPEFPGCEPARRRSWLQRLYPQAEILVLDDDLSLKLTGQPLPHNDEGDGLHREYCARICREVFDVTPAAVFTCEPYGDGFAAHLEDFFSSPVRHVLAGPPRTDATLSGSALRADLDGLKHHLSPHVYADFVQTICFLGAESTGKSTLAASCAQRFGTVHADEYGRTLWEEKEGRLEPADMLLIARTHTTAEDAARETAQRYLFIDTSPLTTLFYALHLFGQADPALEKLAERTYDHVFLCAPDFPLVQDGTRQDEAFRRAQHDWYLQELARRRIDYTLLTGRVEARLQTIEMTLKGENGGRDRI